MVTIHDYILTLQATAEANNLAAVSSAKNQYQRDMESVSDLI